MAGEKPETLLEEREELMVSLSTDANPTHRTAHFIKPVLGSVKQHSLVRPSPLSSPLIDFEPGEWPLKLVFTGWIDPPKNWKIWVHQMHSLHQSTWKKSGIYESIMGSLYKTRRNHDLFWGLVERWCPSTNTFIFSWGEATITLEDIMVLGGFCVIGEPVFQPLQTAEKMNMEGKLLELGMQVSRHQEWMKEFMGNGGELEHIAFLSLWLSRFVFGKKLQNTNDGDLFSVAIHLAHGSRLALGPAVLASIYRDLSLLKGTIMASTELLLNGSDDEFLSLTLQAPLRLVQVWAWERFPGLRPEPKPMINGEPRISRWDRLKKLKIEDVRMVLDSAQDTFQWRPYVTATGNQPFPKFYPEKEEKLVVCPDESDQELQSFAQFLKVCELVGIDCIELYLPHRVAMQFGIDQDLPWTVFKSYDSPETAWSHYTDKLNWNGKLYVPSRLFEADVTTRYLAWWKQSAGNPQADFSWIIRRPRSSGRIRRLRWGRIIEKGGTDDDDDDDDTASDVPMVKKEVIDDYNAEVPLCFAPKIAESYFTNSNVEKTGNDADVPPGFEHISKPILMTEKDMQNKAVAGDSEGAAGHANEVQPRSHIHVSSSPEMNHSEEQQSSCRAVEIPGLELEARISRLERVIAELKAERLAAYLSRTTEP